MTPIADLLAAAERTDAGFRTAIPADWMQGRTAFGGLSAALALQAALDVEPDLPPLRSVQIAFIGPLAGAVTITAAKLRRGRNAAFIQSDVASDAGLGLRATFVFMAELASVIEHDQARRASVAPPAADDQLYTGPDNFFTGNFNFFDPKLKLGPAEWMRWARLRARDGLHPMVELIAIGDALPPGAFKLAGQRQTPLSSLNWQINFLTPEPATQDGWWLLNAAADTARRGYSSQHMSIWNSAGEPIAEAMQGVAIFG
ncbi:thioesterase family protein [Sphingomonas psychrotolerans]|uniref:Thioesterase family protein n=1 Tax=Sphingomonas psychrotolerans TaxID=1327635 RepID=A0ABU3MZV4_9SPHN|nr:thioesterase family protein [Sphingomonas psychrotolerans]MDT8757827.1 thioesterase family protein [Sphingomonas psychrotolerans]